MLKTKLNYIVHLEICDRQEDCLTVMKNQQKFNLLRPKIVFYILEKMFKDKTLKFPYHGQLNFLGSWYSLFSMRQIHHFDN